MDFFFDKQRGHARLVGELTERDDFTELRERIDGELVLDLAGITRVNTAGSHAWMRFVDDLPPQTHVILERCPATFVYLITVVAGFVGRAEVKSVLLPFLCKSCATPVDRTVDVKEIATRGLPEPGTCASCGGALLLDAFEEHYLALARGATTG
jgi:hypothetical protein